MARETWTDERLDDLAKSMREGFARVDYDLRDLRRGMGTEIRAVRSDLTVQIDALRQTIMRFGAAMIVGQFGLIATILARGA